MRCTCMKMARNRQRSQKSCIIRDVGKFKIRHVRSKSIDLELSFEDEARERILLHPPSAKSSSGTTRKEVVRLSAFKTVEKRSRIRKGGYARVGKTRTCRKKKNQK